MSFTATRVVVFLLAFTHHPSFRGPDLLPGLQKNGRSHDVSLPFLEGQAAPGPIRQPNLG